VGPKLALVVGGPAGVEPPLPHRRGEGRGFPELQGIGGLDIVVAVDQDRGGPLVHQALGVEDGMEGGLVELGVKAQGLEPLLKPKGRPAHVCLAGGVGGNRRDGEPLQKGG
jgi:hypothetical protein